MSRHANRRQLALFASGEDLPLFTDAPVQVFEPEPRPTVTPEAPPVASWAWIGTLTPTDAEPVTPNAPEPTTPDAPEPPGEYVYQVWSDTAANFVSRKTERKAYAIQTADFLACDGKTYRVAQFCVTMPATPEKFIYTATPAEIAA